MAVAPGVALLLVLGLAMAMAPWASAAGPCTERGYANGQEVCFFVTHVVSNPSPGLLAHAEPMYVAAFFPLPAGCSAATQSACGPEVLHSGYSPQCDPCFHGGPLNNFPYHDHILEGSPGFGNNGTAGAMEGPWVVIVIVYNPAYSNSPSFVPCESLADVQAGEAMGHFLPINPGASNPYEVNSGVVLIFGVQPF